MDMRTLGKKGPVLKSGFVCNTVLPNQWVGKKIIPSSMMECDGWQQLVISPCHGDHIARSVSVLAPGPAEGVSGSSRVPLPPLTADLISKAGLGRPRGVLLAVPGGWGGVAILSEELPSLQLSAQLESLTSARLSFGSQQVMPWAWSQGSKDGPLAKQCGSVGVDTI